jgi:hypothetical protein
MNNNNFKIQWNLPGKEVLANRQQQLNPSPKISFFPKHKRFGGTRYLTQNCAMIKLLSIPLTTLFQIDLLLYTNL